MMNPWQTLLESTDPAQVKQWRQKVLDDRDYDGSNACFVAMVQILRDELTEQTDNILLSHDAGTWGDNLLSLQLDWAEDDEAQRAALPRGLVELLPEMSTQRSNWAIKILKRHYEYGELSHAEAFRALIETATSGEEFRGPVWKWFVELAPEYVEQGICTAEDVRRALTTAHKGATKKIVAPVLDALGGPLTEGDSPEEQSTSEDVSTWEELARRLGTSVPGRPGAEVQFGDAGEFGQSYLLWAPANAKDLLRTTDFANIVDQILEIMSSFHEPTEWIGRARIFRKRDQWALVRIDRIQTPQDMMAQQPDFSAELVLDDYFGAQLTSHDEPTLAIIALSEGTAAAFWYGPSDPLEFDEGQADETDTLLVRRRW